MNNTRPNGFIISSDFPTLKNEGFVQGDITIPGSIVIPAGGSVSGKLVLDSGSIGSISRGRIASTKNFMNWFTGQGIIFNRTGSQGSYGILALIYRSAPTQITFEVIIQNGYGSTMTGAAGNETIYFYSNQFVAPYN